MHALEEAAHCGAVLLRGEQLYEALRLLILLSAHEAGFLCGASCGSVAATDHEAAALSAAAEAMGLLTEHAYSLLQARPDAR